MTKVYKIGSNKRCYGVIYKKATNNLITQHKKWFSKKIRNVSKKKPSLESLFK